MAIKSFQGKRDTNQPKKADDFLVRDYMTTKLITFKPEQRIEEVIDILLKFKISGGPVVNDKNELIGVISEGDCMRQISDSRYYNMPIDNEQIVENAMAKDVDTIDGDMNILDAANAFLESKRRRFPILKDGKLVGQISQKDVLRAAIQLRGNTWK